MPPIEEYYILVDSQGDHIFEKLNPCVIQDILNFFSAQPKREQFDECIFVIYFSVSQSFPRNFDNFSNSLSFLCFPCLWLP